MNGSTSPIERARQARVRLGQARPLPDPDARRVRFFQLLHQFHASTTNLMLTAGLTAGDLRRYSKEGWIDYGRRSWRPTSRSKERQLSCLTLSAKGRKFKNQLLQPCFNSIPIPDGHLGHDLTLQGLTMLLLSRDQVIDYVGPAVVRAGALKHDCSDFGLDQQYGKRAWSFDGLLWLRSADRSIQYRFAVEVERHPKTAVRDQQRFFDKLDDARHQQCQILVVTETKAAAERWNQTLQLWRERGRPLNGGRFDEHLPLADQGRTVVTSAEVQDLAHLIAGKKKKSGTSGGAPGQRAYAAADLRAIQVAVEDSDWPMHRARLADRLVEIEEAFHHLDERKARPISITASEIWPASPLLSLDEVTRLANTESTYDLARMATLVRARAAELKKLLAPSAADQTARPPKKRFFVF